MTDKRQKTVNWIVRKIKAGHRLSEDDVQKCLYLARDYVLMELAKMSVAGQHKEAKASAKLFNVLQPAVERYEMVHGKDEKVRHLSLLVPGVDYDDEERDVG